MVWKLFWWIFLNEYCSNIKRRRLLFSGIQIVREKRNNKKEQQRSFMVSILTQYNILFFYFNIKNCLKYTITDCNLKISAILIENIQLLALFKKKVQRRLKAYFLRVLFVL